MEIFEEAYDSDPGGALVLRSSPAGNLIFVLLAGILVMGAVLGGARIVAAMAPMVILLASVPIAMVGLALCVMFSASIHALCASLRPTNWSVQVGSQSLVINLRDYRNAKPGEPVPALTIPLGEISKTVEVTEQWTRQGRGPSKDSHAVQRKYVDLILQGIDTAPLAAVLLKERRRNSQKSPTENRGSKIRFHDLGVIVVQSGVVRLASSKRLVEVLSHLMKFDQPQRIDLDDQLASEPSLLRARAMDLRGERVQATNMLAQEEGLSHSEARELLDQALEPDCW
jgi:hypothetical protein